MNKDVSDMTLVPHVVGWDKALAQCCGDSTHRSAKRSSSSSSGSVMLDVSGRMDFYVVIPESPRGSLAQRMADPKQPAVVRILCFWQRQDEGQRDGDSDPKV